MLVKTSSEIPFHVKFIPFPVRSEICGLSVSIHTSKYLTHMPTFTTRNCELGSEEKCVRFPAHATVHDEIHAKN